MSSTITPADLKRLLGKKQEIFVIDVRRKSDYEASGQDIPGSVWRDPEKVDQWSKELPQKKAVIIYCVRGGSVSKSISARLLEEKVDVRYVEGGFSAWKDSGGEVRPKNADNL